MNQLPDQYQLKKVLEDGSYTFRNEALVQAYVHRKLEKDIELYRKPSSPISYDRNQDGWDPARYIIPSCYSITLGFKNKPIVNKRSVTMPFFPESENSFTEIIEKTADTMCGLPSDDFFSNYFDNRHRFALKVTKHDLRVESGLFKDGEETILDLEDLISIFSEDGKVVLQKMTAESRRVGTLYQNAAIELLQKNGLEIAPNSFHKNLSAAWALKQK